MRVLCPATIDGHWQETCSYTGGSGAKVAGKELQETKALLKL